MTTGMINQVEKTENMENIAESQSSCADPGSNALASRKVLNLLKDSHASHGRRGVVLAVQASPGLQAVAFTCVPTIRLGASVVKETRQA